MFSSGETLAFILSSSLIFQRRRPGAWPLGAACQGEWLLLPVASQRLPLCKSNKAAGLTGSRVLPASLAEGWR